MSKPLTPLQDPLCQRIVERLETLTDGGLFERCASSLLRELYPTLVPVSGGSDGGRDGAIADGEAEAYPLICTIGQRPERNLKESLASYAKLANPRRKAVFATSRRLTPVQEEKLKGVAREQGIFLEQVYDQERFAELLYYSSRWRRELGIIGSVSALSPFPKSRRPFEDIPLVGREADLKWLRETPGDLLLVGQPGAGKTFLLRKMAQEGRALFVVLSDAHEIKKAILDRRLDEPGEIAVALDDAHGRLDVLESLFHLREQLEAEFRIIATCWPGSKDDVATAMGSGRVSSRDLELLTRKEIAEVYASVGIDLRSLGARYSRPSPEVLLKRLIDLAANKPGLAMTMAHLVESGEETAVFSGEALLREVRSLQKILGGDPIRTLAGFAVGGEAGMPMDAVAELRGVAPSEIQQEVISLAAGGVLSDLGHGNLAVEPQPLRSALLAEVFFREDSLGISPQPLVERAPDPVSAVFAVICLKEAEATVDEDRLLGWVEEADPLVRADAGQLSWLVEPLGSAHRPEELQRALEQDSDDFWGFYASSGFERAQRASESFPRNLLRIGDQLLRGAPTKAVGWLIRASAEGPGEPRRQEAPDWISSWLTTSDPSLSPGDKRRLLQDQVRPLLEDGSQQAVAFKVLLLIFSLRVEETSVEPTVGGSVTYRTRGLSLEELRGVHDVWMSVRGALPAVQPEWARAIRRALEPWLVPRWPRPGGEWSNEEKEILRATAVSVLRDLSKKAVRSWAFASEFQRLAASAGEDLGLELAEDYEALFSDLPSTPSDSVLPRDEPEESLRALAEQWSQKEPAWVADRLGQLASEARLVGHVERRVPLFCEEIANRVSDPDSWLRKFHQADLGNAYVYPFLARAAGEDSRAWAQVAKERLAEERSIRSVLGLVLSAPRPEADLMELVMARLPSFLDEVWTLCLRQEVPPPTLELLWQHSDWKVACSAAIGAWCALDEQTAGKQLEPSQRKALLRTRGAPPFATAEYWLGQILGTDKDLAFDWLHQRVQDGEIPGGFSLPQYFSLAIRSLDASRRSKILSLLPPSGESPALAELVRELVGDDLDLYRTLLASRALRAEHLRPLAGKPGTAWPKKVLLASRAGYSPREIARSTLRGGGVLTISGDGIEFWEGWRDSFRRFEADSRDRVRQAALQGVELAQAELQKAQSKKRQRELTGYF